ncbi:(Fe-S)-binding protein [Peribacillus muralis]|uniref:(Fe-S)-binding protein n=1 Tax=Peribacillus muralis TaxID=264697 RepID=UPI00366E40CA
MTKQENAAAELKSKVYDKVNSCIQCGYCLPACPTYKSMETESASPRGRINLVKMAAEGKIDITEDLKKPIDLCLGCRACEIACPVNVPYGSILEDAKEMIKKKEDESKKKPYMKDWLMNSFFTNSKMLQVSSNLLYLYQETGLQKISRKTKLPEKILGNIGKMEKTLPTMPSPKYRIKKGQMYKAKNPETKMTVALFLGCINDSLLYKVNYYTLELLRLAGCDVYIPKNQGCCGALHAHQGYMDTAKQLASDNLNAFEEHDVQYIVTNAGGCGAILKEYNHFLKDGTGSNSKSKVDEFTSKIKDISEVLYELDTLKFEKNINKVVTYQPSCHLKNVQKVDAIPEKLIKSISGITYVELPDKDSCCASGGVYNVINYDESMKILSGKFQGVNHIQPDLIVTSNPGCLLQMSHGVNEFSHDKQAKSIHLVELLAEACRIEI